MKKGINQLCFPESFSVGRMLELASDVGFDGFELSVDENGGVSRAGPTGELQALAREGRRRGLDLHSVSTTLHWKYPLSSRDREVRERGMEIASFMIRAASAVGADAVLIVPGVAEPQVPYRLTYEIAQESLRALSAEASEHGVRLGVENVWNRFLQGPLEMLRFIEELDSPSVGVYLDIGNLMINGYPQHWIQVLCGHLVKVHIKDFLSGVGNVHGFTHLLHGDVPWADVVRELRAAGYDGYLTAELPPAESYTGRLIREVCDSMGAIIEEGA